MANGQNAQKRTPVKELTRTVCGVLPKGITWRSKAAKKLNNRRIRHTSKARLSVELEHVA